MQRTVADPQVLRGSSLHPAFSGRALFTIEQRPAGNDDEANTAQTVGRMVEYIREDSLHPIVRRAALDATRNAGADVRLSIHPWIRSHVRFVDDAELAKEITDDPLSAEVLVRPVDLLTMPRPAGDCDDQSMLCAAMLRALGVRTWLKTIAADPADPSRYSHVYVIADGPGGPMSVDASHGPYPGWEARAVGKTKLWPVDEEKENMRSNLGFTPEATGTPWWQTVVTSGEQIAGNIFTARYGVPQLANGQTVTMTPAGTYASQYPAGAILGGGSNSSSMLLLLVAGLAVVIIATRK